MTQSAQIFDEREIAALKNGEIEGDAYEDGSFWAEVPSLMRWRNEQPIAALEASAEIAQ